MFLLSELALLTGLSFFIGFFAERIDRSGDFCAFLSTVSVLYNNIAAAGHLLAGALEQKGLQCLSEVHLSTGC